MYKTINSSQFKDAFKLQGRESHFSSDGLSAIYDYLEDMESTDDIGVELDVIALCGRFNEYETFDEFVEEYSDFCEDYGIVTVDDIAQHTLVIKIPDCKYVENTPKNRFIIEPL